MELTSRSFKKSDESHVLKWKIDTPVCVPGHAIIARSRLIGFEERLQTYAEWRAVTVERRLPHGTSQPIACSGWGLKLVRFRDRQLRIAYMIDGFSSAASSEVSVWDLAVLGDPVKPWRETLDGEQAVCCTAATMSTIEMATMVRHGYTSLGSFRRYNWCDVQHESLRWEEPIPPHEVLVFKPNDTRVLTYWLAAFENSALLPVDLKSFVSDGQYLGTVVLRSTANPSLWACVTRWGGPQHFCIPACAFELHYKARRQRVEDPSMRLRHELMCFLGTSKGIIDNPQCGALLAECIKIAGRESVAAGSADFLTAIVDESLVMHIHNYFNSIRATNLRYANGVKLHGYTLAPNTQLPTFWDPRDLGPVYCFCGKGTGNIPKRMLAAAEEALSPEVSRFVLGTAGAPVDTSGDSSGNAASGGEATDTSVHSRVVPHRPPTHSAFESLEQPSDGEQEEAAEDPAIASPTGTEGPPQQGGGQQGMHRVVERLGSAVRLTVSRCRAALRGVQNHEHHCRTVVARASGQHRVSHLAAPHHTAAAPRARAVIVLVVAAYVTSMLAAGCSVITEYQQQGYVSQRTASATVGSITMVFIRSALALLVSVVLSELLGWSPQSGGKAYARVVGSVDDSVALALWTAFTILMRTEKPTSQTDLAEMQSQAGDAAGWGGISLLRDTFDDAMYIALPFCVAVLYVKGHEGNAASRGPGGGGAPHTPLTQRTGSPGPPSPPSDLPDVQTNWCYATLGVASVVLALKLLCCVLYQLIFRIVSLLIDVR